MTGAVTAASSAVVDVGRTLHAFSIDDAIACGENVLQHSGLHAVGMAHFLEQVALHPACAEELETKCEAQTRCAQKWYKIAIHALTVASERVDADSMWKRATALRVAEDKRDSAPIGWPSSWQTPTVWISSLRSMPTWDCGNWPFVSELEAAAPRILDEILSAESRFATAYPYLTQRGTWQDMFLYRGHDWDHALCAAMPLTCRLLVPSLPTKPGVPYTTVYNEEVVIFRTEPGAAVGEHCGSSNAVVNLHLTLTGARGTTLRISGEEYPLQDGKTICFQDSYFHAIEHRGDAEAERISLVVRAMHPSMSIAAFGASARTDVVDDLGSWDEAAEVKRDLERLRIDYRKLAKSVAVQNASADPLVCEGLHSLSEGSVE